MGGILFPNNRGGSQPKIINFSKCKELAKKKEIFIIYRNKKKEFTKLLIKNIKGKDLAAPEAEPLKPPPKKIKETNT